MDSPEPNADTQDEVRKLQKLVKKLERQNEALRNKQSNGSSQRNGENEMDTNNLNDYDQPTDFHKSNFVDALDLDDFDDVNFADLSVEDDSWLYASPKTLNHSQSKEPLLKWVRQDFDHPSPEVEVSRKALISKLEEVARVKQSSMSPMAGGQPISSRSSTALNRTVVDSGHVYSKTGLSAKSGAASTSLDSGMHTRQKDMMIPLHGEGDQSRLVPYMTGTTDISDIENLAKQQEENLRQSVTPASRKAMRAKHALMDGDNGARLSPSRFDLEAYLPHHRGSLGSDHSTPPDSPHNSNQYSHSSHLNDPRGRYGFPPHPSLQHRSHNSSDSSLERHSVASDEMNTVPEATRTPSRLQQPSYSTPKRGIPPGLAPGLAQQQQPRGSSPQRMSGLPTPHGKMIKPLSGVRSSLPKLHRTNVPSPKPQSSDGHGEAWRDGCF